MLRQSLARLLESYPAIYFACRARELRDGRNRKVISAHQASILHYLNGEGLCLKDLAASVGVTVSTMSLNVERLLRKGLILRVRDTRDRRRVQLRLSAAGWRIKKAQVLLDPTRLQDVLARLSLSEMKLAAEAVGLLARAASGHVKTSRL